MPSFSKIKSGYKSRYAPGEYIGVWYLPSGNVCVGLGEGFNPQDAIKDMRQRYLGLATSGSQFLGITKYPLTDTYSPVLRARWLFRVTASNQIGKPWEKPSNSPHWYNEDQDRLRRELERTREFRNNAEKQLYAAQDELAEVYDKLSVVEADLEDSRERIVEIKEAINRLP